MGHPCSIEQVCNCVGNSLSNTAGQGHSFSVSCCFAKSGQRLPPETLAAIGESRNATLSVLRAQAGVQPKQVATFDTHICCESCLVSVSNRPASTCPTGQVVSIFGSSNTECAYNTANRFLLHVYMGGLLCRSSKIAKKM